MTTKTAVKEKPTEHPVTCICGNPMKLRYSAKFPKNPWFYGCSTYPKCQTTHGCHQENGKPLGKPADKETKDWRIRAHDAFDKLWKDGGPLNRHQAYAWISHRMGFQVHMGESDIDTCKKVIELVNEFSPEKG